MVEYYNKSSQNVIFLHGREWMATETSTMGAGSKPSASDHDRSKEEFPTVIPGISFRTYDRTLTFNVTLLTLGMGVASFIIAFILLSLGTLFGAG